VANHAQLELFADRPPTPSATNSGTARRLVPEHLSDAALIAALPEESLADACALAPRRDGGDLAMRSERLSPSAIGSSALASIAAFPSKSRRWSPFALLVERKLLDPSVK
jgi:hypothetical protein